MPAFYIEKQGSDLILHNKYGIYSKNELEHQLQSGHLTMIELGQVYHLRKYQFTHIFRSLGILYRNNLNDTRIIDSTITPRMHQILLGTLLGDAYMTEPKSYSLTHSIYQMEYLYDVANNLNPFIATIGDRKLKLGESIFLWTYRHDVFIPYFNHFYSHGKSKKFLNAESIQGLDPIGLAYWYMDDGKFSEYGANLCVGNITSEEGSILIKYLKDTFNINSTFQNHDIKKGYHNIYIKAESRSHFFNLIEPHIVPSLSYKLSGDPPPKIFSEEAVIKKHAALCSISKRCIRYKGRDIITDEILKNKNNTSDYKQIFLDKIQDDIKNGRQISFTKFREVPSVEELRKMFIEKNMTDKQIAQCLGYGRHRIALLRHSLGIARRKCRNA